MEGKQFTYPVPAVSGNYNRKVVHMGFIRDVLLLLGGAYLGLVLGMPIFMFLMFW